MSEEKKTIEVLSDQDLDQVNGGVIGTEQISMAKGVIDGLQKDERSKGFKSSAEFGPLIT